MSNAIFIRLEPFQANFLLWCSARFAHFCQLNVKGKREKASADKGILRCAVLYPTSCHLFKDCSPKILGCLERLQCLLYSSPLTTKPKQTLDLQNPYHFCLVICYSSPKNSLCFLQLLFPLPYPTIPFIHYPIKTSLIKVAINLQVPKSNSHFVIPF